MSPVRLVPASMQGELSCRRKSLQLLVFRNSGALVMLPTPPGSGAVQQ